MLREQTRLTGALHEAQVLQLKMWPMVVFDTASASRFTWDPEGKVVTFTVTIKNQKLAWWKQRVTILNEWVQTLLGKDWVIRVQAGKKTFAGQRGASDIRNRPISD